MRKYTLEMNYIVNLNVVVNANTEDEAIERAKKMVEKHVEVFDTGCSNRSESVHSSELMFEEVTFIAD